MKNQDLNHIIEKYLDESLSPEEAAAFNRQLAEDPELREKLRRYENAEKVIDKYREHQLEERFMARGRKRLRSQRNGKMTLGILALALLIVAGIWLVPDWDGPQPEPEPEQLENLEPKRPQASLEELIRDVNAPSLPNLLGEEDRLGEQWQELRSLFREDRYRDYLNAAEKRLAEPPFAEAYGDPTRLLMGYSYLQLGEGDNAERSFTGIDKSSAFARQADWYLALIQLERGDERGIAGIREIAADKQHPKSREASRFLEAFEQQD